jgi:radical SAM protein with 4Fe4S-binding SPASM domain
MTEPSYSRRESLTGFDPLHGRSPLLGEIDIELTERCNNRCIHCYINRPEHDREAEAREMETEFVIDVLRQAADLGCLEVRFTGGEPLLRRDFAEIYVAARRLGMKVVLFTNGRLITPEVAGLLARMPPGRMVEVSVYGMQPGSYDAGAGVRGAFREFQRGVDLLLEHEIPFVVKLALLPQNRGETARFREWAAAIPSMTGRPGYIANFDLRARRDDPDKNRRIRGLRLTPEETVAIATGDPDYRANMHEFCTRFLGPPGDRLFTCGAGRGVSVDSYGFAQMCLSLRHPDTVEDLRKASLRQVLLEAFPRYRERRATDQEYLRRCAVCFLKGLCEQCPARSWMEHGTLDTPVQYCCDVAHAHARELGLLGDDEYGWEVPDWRQRIKLLTDGAPDEGQ